MLSDSPPEKDINWSESGINGSWKICQKIWTLINEHKEYLSSESYSNNMSLSNEAKELMYLCNQNLDAITRGIEKFQMNVSIARVFAKLLSIPAFLPAIISAEINSKT